MSQIVFYKYLIIVSSVFYSFLDAKLLKPSQNGEEKEVLIISGKRRLYYPILDEGLVYSLSGPAKIEFLTRFPVLKKKKNSHKYSYVVIIDKKDTINIKHRYKVQKNIKSVQHPKHSYTYSGNYFINIPDGKHTISILPEPKIKYPVLLRLLSKEFESLKKKKSTLTPMIHKNPISLNVNNKKLSYFECDNKFPLQIQVAGKTTLRILSRLAFTSDMGKEESYRIRIRENKKIVGTYYFSTERSSASQLGSHSDKVPGRWRSCEIEVSKGKHIYSIEMADENKVSLMRFSTF